MKKTLILIFILVIFIGFTSANQQTKQLEKQNFGSPTKPTIQECK